MGGEAAVKAWILLFLALFSWPFLGAFDFPATFLGVPSFLAAVFLLWALLVYALIAVSRRGEE